MENYSVLKLVGEGSFGKVYKSRRKHTGQICAMKFILKAGKSERDIRSFRQEIEIMREIRHENIIQMLDYFETNEEFCVVTEFAQGDLFEVLEDDEQLPEEQVRIVAKQLVRALHYLHTHRIIHRDMKPQNILVSPSGTIKLCDFGFARALSQKSMLLTSIKGTPLYMAPELVQEQAYDHTVDLWSVGVILYELHQGKPPFFTNNIYALIQMIVKDNVKFPKNMSQEFQSFLKGLLTKSAKCRLNWPGLLEHPFVKESESERLVREERLYNQRLVAESSRSWRGENGAIAGAAEVAAEVFSENDKENAQNAQHVPDQSILQHALRDEEQILQQNGIKTQEDNNQRHENGSNNQINSKFSPIFEFCEDRNKNQDINAIFGHVQNAQNALNDISNLIQNNNNNNSKLKNNNNNNIQQIQQLEAGWKALNLLISIIQINQEISDEIINFLIQIGNWIINFPEIPKLNQISNFKQEPMQKLINILLRINFENNQQLNNKFQLEILDLAMNSVISNIACEICSKCVQLYYQNAWQQLLKNINQFQKEDISQLNQNIYFNILNGVSSNKKLAQIILFGLESGFGIEIAASVVFVESQIKHKRVFPLCVALTQNEGGVNIFSEYELQLWQLHKNLTSWLARQIFLIDGNQNQNNALQILINKIKQPISLQQQNQKKQSVLMCALRILRVIVVDSAQNTAIQMLLQKGIVQCLLEVLCSSSATWETDTLSGSILSKILESSINQFSSSEQGRNFLRQNIQPEQLINTIEIAIQRHKLATYPVAAAVLLNVVAQTITLFKILQFQEQKIDYIATFQRLLLTTHQQTQQFQDKNQQNQQLQQLNQKFQANTSQWQGQGQGQGQGQPQSQGQHFYYNTINETLNTHAPQGQGQTLNNHAPQGQGQTLNNHAPQGQGQTLNNHALQGQGQNSPQNQGQGYGQTIPVTQGQGQGQDFEIVDGYFCTMGVMRGIVLITQKLLNSNGVVHSALIQSIDNSINCGERKINTVLTNQCDPISTNILVDSMIQMQPEIFVSEAKILVPFLKIIIGDTHLEGIREWTKISKSEYVQVETLISKVFIALNNPLKKLQQDSSLSRYHRELGEHQVVPCATCIIKILSEEQDLFQPVDFLARLLALGEPFLKQFSSSSGISSEVIRKLLNPEFSNQFLTNSLQIYNQCARANGDSQDALGEAQVVSIASNLLDSEDASVRARTANLVGNLCRHGQKLYGEIDRYLLIPKLVQLCEDQDRSVRKFACFALGNAGFHSSFLYPHLRCAIPPLITLLSDEDPKTRTNAAGALGNLVRNSDLLCQDLVDFGALQSLLQVIDQAENLHPQPNPGASEGSSVRGRQSQGQGQGQGQGLGQGSPVRIALFSLGNMCSHSVCKQVLEKLGIREIIGKLHDSQDEAVRKYVERISTKLQIGR